MSKPLDDFKKNLKIAQRVVKFCTKYMAEVNPLGDGNIQVIIPRPLSSEAEEELQQTFPEGTNYQVKILPKNQTRNNLMNIIHRADIKAGSIEPDLDHRRIIIDLPGIPESDPIWAELSEVLKSDGFFDSWNFIADGHDMSILPKVVDEVSKNKNRRVIGDGDIMDLKISLANAQTAEDILKAIGG